MKSKTDVDWIWFQKANERKIRIKNNWKWKEKTFYGICGWVESFECGWKIIEGWIRNLFEALWFNVIWISFRDSWIKIEMISNKHDRRVARENFLEKFQKSWQFFKILYKNSSQGVGGILPVIPSYAPDAWCVYLKGKLLVSCWYLEQLTIIMLERCQFETYSSFLRELLLLIVLVKPKTQLMYNLIQH